MWKDREGNTHIVLHARTREILTDFNYRIQQNIPYCFSDEFMRISSPTDLFMSKSYKEDWQETSGVWMSHPYAGQYGYGFDGHNDMEMPWMSSYYIGGVTQNQYRDDWYAEIQHIYFESGYSADNDIYIAMARIDY